MQLQGFRLRAAIAPRGTNRPTTLYWFAIKQMSASDEAEGLDTTNTEGLQGGTSANSVGVGTGERNALGEPRELFDVGPGGRASVTPGVAKARVELTTATFIYRKNNPFLAPFSFRSQAYYTIVIFPNRGNLLRGHVFDSCLATSVRHEGEVGGLQPVTLTLESDGDYNLYTPVVGFQFRTANDT